MSIDNIKQKLPEYAKDLKLNLSSLLNAPSEMSEQQLWGTLLASAIASRNAEVIQAVSAEAKEHLSEEAVNAAKASAAIMAMNNIYYRFIHLSTDKQFQTMPARLRMNIIAKPGVEKVDFELWSLAVSAINGCGMCIDAHNKELKDKGVSAETIQHAIRIASIVHAVSVTLEAASLD
ncbi:carboxymuconolactone decarboxylase family protein [bacterium]|nr:carboxymuconolactone decarboxylase family protein [bacterium]